MCTGHRMWVKKWSEPPCALQTWAGDRGCARRVPEQDSQGCCPTRVLGTCMSFGPASCCGVLASPRQLGPPRVSQSAGAVMWTRWLRAPIWTSLHNFIKQIHPQSSWAVEFRDSLTPSSAYPQIHFWRQHTVWVLTEFFQEMLIMGLTSCASLPCSGTVPPLRCLSQGPFKLERACQRLQQREGNS